MIERGRLTVLTLAIQIKKLDGRRMLVAPDGHDLLGSHGVEHPRQPNPTLVRALAQAHAWHRELVRTGASIKMLAQRLGEHESRMHALLPLAHLGPDLVRAILTGSLPTRITLKHLRTAAQRLDWNAQKSVLGLGSS